MNKQRDTAIDYTLRFCAYPDTEIASEAWRHIELHRQIRDPAIRDYYRSPRNVRPSEFDKINRLPGWKRQWPVFGEFLAHAVQQTVSQIHKDLTVLEEHRTNGRKTGRLMWKGSGEFRSVAYQSEGYDMDQNTDRDGWQHFPSRRSEPCRSAPIVRYRTLTRSSASF